MISYYGPLQLAEEDELMWDDGSVNPEPCLDRFDLVTKVCAANKVASVPEASAKVAVRKNKSL